MIPLNQNILSSDASLYNPKDDRLGYASFAKHLASAISKATPMDGLVIAIYGSWGYGKSTLLNFTEYYLQNGPEEDKPLVIRFNPWWFSGREDLIKHFFEQLQAGLSNSQCLINRFKEVSDSIAKYMDALAEAPLPHSWLVKFLARCLRTFAKPKDLTRLKKAVTDALKKRGGKILMIIDDLDRLTKEEIREIVSLVKAVADFPNVIYLLAFDKTIVAKALNGLHLGGESYLEKIVQLPLELPLPDSLGLEKLFLEMIDAICEIPANESFDTERWGNIYSKWIKHFLLSPRDVIRLTNVLRFSYPPVKGEVNPIDFISIETLRVFLPAIYDTIRKNPDSFIGTVDELGAFGPKPNAIRPFHDSWLNSLEGKKDLVKGLMCDLFPILETVWENRNHRDSEVIQWRKSWRICSPDYFPVYFRSSIPEGGMSNLEMKSILALSTDSKVFADKLSELAKQKRPDGATRAAAFLDRLEDYVDDLNKHIGKEIPRNAESSIVKALLKVGDELLLSEDTDAAK